MVFVVLCSILALFTFAQVAEKDACDNKRVRADCIGSPESCYWDNSKEGTGHACVKFSGDCRTIITNNSAVCTGAGGGGLCNYLLDLGMCVNNCTLLNYSNSICSNQPHCIFAGGIPNRCLRCEEITVDTECISKDYCKWNASITGFNKCSVDRCRTLYTSSNYYYDDNNECNRDSTCYVRTDYYNGDCKEFINCASMTTGVYGYSCYSRDDCTYDGSSSSCQVINSITTCATYISRDNCLGNVSCYWDSSVSKCFGLDGNCGNVQTGNSSDCSSARRDFSGNVKNCTWKEGIGCVTSCTDYPQTFESTCRYNRDDCWWDSGAYNGCKNFSSCGDINNDQTACLNHNKTCYWNGTRCSNYTHCSQIANSSICDALNAKCKWNSTACVDRCSEIKNVYDCYSREECYWLGEKCYEDTGHSCSSLPEVNCNAYKNCYYDGGCNYFSQCSNIYYNSKACNSPGKNCTWEWTDTWGNGRCVPEIFYPVNDTAEKGCSAYSNYRACNADSACVFNQKIDSNNYHSQCQNFTSCSDITYVEFGGAHYYPWDDCNNKPGCYWKVTSDKRPGCGNVLGECLKDDTVERCTEYLDSVTCDGKSGCFWKLDSPRECVPWSCSLFNGNKSYCTANEQCEFDEDSDVCNYKCSKYVTNDTCKEDLRCFWNGSKCDVFDKCSSLTNYEECWLRRGDGSLEDCGWVSTSVNDINVGYCATIFDKFSLEIKGCDDYKNAEQCDADSYFNTVNCTFIWDVEHNGGICTATNQNNLQNCSWYKNKEQCGTITPGGTSGCYWNSAAGGYCQEFSNCSDILSTFDCESALYCGVVNMQCSNYGSCEYRNKTYCLSSPKCEYREANKSCFTKPVINPRSSNSQSHIQSQFHSLSNEDGGNMFILSAADQQGGPCRGNGSNQTLCNGDKLTCSLGCVFNTQRIGGSSGCILFRSCADIKYPLFQNPQLDCDARIPCYWANGKCGLDPPTSAAYTKKSLSLGVTGILLLLTCLWSL